LEPDYRLNCEAIGDKAMAVKAFQNVVASKLNAAEPRVNVRE
jgi:hypothetical protein